MDILGSLFTASFSRVYFALSQLGIVSIISYFGHPNDVGLYGLCLAIMVPLCGFLGMGIRVGIATDQSDSYNLAECLENRFITCVIITIIFCGICLAIYPKNVIFFGICLLIPKLSDLFNEMFYGFYQKFNCLENINKSLNLRSLSSPLLMLITIWITQSVKLAILVWGFSWFYIAYRYDFQKIQIIVDKGNQFSARTDPFVKKIIRYFKTFWSHKELAVSTLIGGLANFIPIFFIERYGGNGSLNTFTLIFVVFNAVNTITARILMTGVRNFSGVDNTNFPNRFDSNQFRVIAAFLVLIILMNIIIHFYGINLFQILFGGLNSFSNDILKLFAYGFSVKILNNIAMVLLQSKRLFKLCLIVDIVTLIIITSVLLFFYTGNPLLSVFAQGFLIAQVVVFIFNFILITKINNWFPRQS